MSDVAQLLLVGCGAGIVGGLWLLAQGVRSYRRSTTVADVATSRISTLAMGEVRISGRVEAAELTLMSPLQSHACVYYRASVTASQGRTSETLLREERAVGFRVRDESGAIRVFPRGAGWDVPDAFDAHDGLAGEPPPELELRAGPAYQVGRADESELVARLLTVHRDSELDALRKRGSSGGNRQYKEARVDVGDVVTIVGTALPFDQLPNPGDAAFGDSAVGGPLAATDDPAIAADLAAARASGELETDPQKAWGNAAIEGFGIGQPVRAPELDPAANPEPVVDAGTAAGFRATFHIAPEEPVIAAGPGAPVLVALGAPSQAVARGRNRFALGLAGAALTIASMAVLAVGFDAGWLR
ncbi:MAG TPA: hypothetical protein VJ850_13060 [Candidatus Limnocylindrales bacterium]|nr:hypothetical protein [Candidatus Limnocylindrales bacterium]